MKRVLIVAFAAAWIGWAVAPASAGAEQSWRGVVSDNQCKGDHGGEVDERECTLKCTKSGEKFVLVTDFGKTVWQIANQNFSTLSQHAGHTVRLTGELKSGAITVSKIEM